MPSTGQDIITALSLWRSFPVISGSSTFSYKGQSSDIRKVARDLGARYINEGSIRLSDQRVRVAAQLIDADSGHHVWGPRIFRGRSDLVASDAEAGMGGGPRPSRQHGRALGSGARAVQQKRISETVPRHQRQRRFPSRPQNASAAA